MPTVVVARAYHAKEAKLLTNRAEPSARNDRAAAATAEPPAPQPQSEGAAVTRAWEETLEGNVKEVELDQNSKEIEE